MLDRQTKIDIYKTIPFVDPTKQLPVNDKPYNYDLNDGLYVLKDERIHYGSGGSIRGADIDSFVQYANGFAIDKKHVYMYGRRIKGADPETFTILNYAWAKDANHVYSFKGIVADADADTFEVLDDGIYIIEGMYSPENGPRNWFRQANGYAKDNDNVFTVYGDLKAQIIKGADVETFEPILEHYPCALYGRDKKSVYLGNRKLPKSNPESWKLLDNYSIDEKHVYYNVYLVKGADAETFEEIPTYEKRYVLGRDKNFGYDREKQISLEELDIEIKKAEEYLKTF
jgi:hypothetical protein